MRSCADSRTLASPMGLFAHVAAIVMRTNSSTAKHGLAVLGVSTSNQFAHLAAGHLSDHAIQDQYRRTGLAATVGHQQESDLAVDAQDHGSDAAT